MLSTNYPILETKDDKNIVKVPCREYTFENSCFPTSIRSMGQEILNAPIRLVCEANGERELFEPAETFTVDYKEDVITLVSTMHSKVLFINNCINIEEDGCAFVALSIMPRGLTAQQVFGLEPIVDHKRVIDKLWLEIPIQKACATYYQVGPRITEVFGDIEFSGVKYDPSKDSGLRALSWSGFTPKSGFSTTFTNQVMLANDDVGFGCFFYNHKYWNIGDEKKAFEVIENGDEYILRIHILDGESEAWCGMADQAGSIHLDPITFKFGFCATPYRELPSAPFIEKAFQLDCFKKTAGDYEAFLSNPVVEGDTEIGFDRLKRLGVEVLYIHERWNDMQNSPLLTDRTKKRARYIIEECHKRGIKVVPYFGMEISSLSPYFAEHGEEWKVKFHPDSMRNTAWSRQPSQRALKVCLNSGWADVLIDGIIRVIEELGFDGVYLDSTMVVRNCANQAHGCGYQDKAGNWHVTYQQEGIRKVFKALYQYVSRRGLIMNSHGGGAMNLVALGYCTSVWEGETFQEPLLHGKIAKMPEGHIRFSFGSKLFGVPIYSLCYSNDPVWTYHNAVATQLLHNSMPKPVDIGAPLEETSRIWKVYDAFPIAKSRWMPYYTDHGVITSDDRVKVSYYDAGNELLVIVAGTETGIDSTVTVDFSALGITGIADAFTGETVSEDGKYTTDVSGFEYRLLRMTR